MNSSLKGLIALVAEDDWLLRQDLVSGLEDEGATVLEAATGGGALAVLGGCEKIDLLVTDIQLADSITGWDVAETFRAADAEIPVIYASGNPPNDSRRVAGSIFLSKPLAAAKLVDACAALLGRQRGSARTGVSSTFH